MATSTFPATGGFVDNTSAATFVPEIWSDEIRAAYEKNLILANLVKKMSMSGKKGDTIHIPAPIRGAAYAKAENTAVTVQNNTESEVQVVVDKHYEYSRIIEDITEVQALASLRNFYTGDAGYALSRQVDNDLFQLGKSLGDGDGSDWTNTAVFYNDASTGLTAYAADTVAAADVFTDAGFRALIQKQDDADVPMDNRAFVIPPSLRNAIMGIDRYVSSDFVGGATVQNGKIGNLYGIDVYVSSNCPIIEAAADNSAGGDVKAAMLIHQDTLILAEQVSVRSQTQYKQEFLGTLYTADTLYGVKAYRPDSGFVLAVNG
jgi:N4-gp56 family major capsid protein